MAMERLRVGFIKGHVFVVEFDIRSSLDASTQCSFR
jgi:hypothetical protein